jgi:hypothetical protein
MKLRKPSILVVNWDSSYLPFFRSASTAATYIFTAPNCTTTIISLEPCALNAEYQHFIVRFIKISFTLQIPLKEGIGGERTPHTSQKSALDPNTRTSLVWFLFPKVPYHHNQLVCSKVDTHPILIWTN